MNPLKKLSIVVAAAIPAVALFAGVATAVVEDHVTNGGFNINAKGWTAGADASVKKHEGFPIGVVTNEKNSTGASSVTASQCVQLYNGLKSYFEGRVMIPSNQERSGSAAFVVTLYSDQNCGVPIKEIAPGMFHTTQDWKKFEFELPSGAESAKISMAVTKGKSLLKPKAPFMAFFDDIKLIQHPLSVAGEDEEENDCLCEPAAPTDGPAAEPEPAAPTDDGPIPADAGKDPTPEPVAPAADEPVDVPTVTPGVPADEPAADEPAGPAQQPQQPSADPATQQQDDSTSDGSSDDGDGTPGAPATGSTQPDADQEGVDSAETSGQYELTPSDGGEGQREPASGRGVDTPGAPETGFNLGGTKDLVGADELGILGGVLAAFGLTLAAIAIRRERAS